jgi:hypothetical protein
VLVIIGLIVGAITAGTSLINQAKIRSVISELRNIQISVNTFKLTYGTLPGDLTNALNYWPAVASTPTANLVNGNGNGAIEISSPAEMDTFFQTLSLSGLISNTLAFGALYKSTYGNGYRVLYSSTYSGSGQSGNLIDTIKMDWTSNALYFPKDAMAIDNKIDDGIFYTGTVITSRSNSIGATANRCTALATSVYNATYATVLNDTYSYTDNTRSCGMQFYMID